MAFHSRPLDSITTPDSPASLARRVTGFVFLNSGTRALMAAKRSGSWPSTGGMITESVVEQNAKLDFSEAVFGNYRASIRYVYTVAAIRHVGTAVFPGRQPDYTNYAGARKLTELYPRGGTVPLYYNSIDRKQSVLRPGTEPFHWIPIVVGTFLLFAGPIIAIIGRDKYRR